MLNSDNILDFKIDTIINYKLYIFENIHFQKKEFIKLRINCDIIAQ